MSHSFNLTPSGRQQYRKDGKVVAQSSVPGKTRKSLITKALGTSELENQPLEVYLNMTKNMSAREVHKLCSTSRTLNRVICDNPDFWAQWARRQPGSRLHNQPLHVFVEILSDSSLDEVVVFCNTSRFLQHSLCDNANFWRAWFKQHKDKAGIVNELLDHLGFASRVESAVIVFARSLKYNELKSLDVYVDYMELFGLKKHKLTKYDIWKFAVKESLIAGDISYLLENPSHFNSQHYHITDVIKLFATIDIDALEAVLGCKSNSEFRKYVGTKKWLDLLQQVVWAKVKLDKRCRLIIAEHLEDMNHTALRDMVDYFKR